VLGERSGDGSAIPGEGEGDRRNIRNVDAAQIFVTAVGHITADGDGLANRGAGVGALLGDADPRADDLEGLCAGGGGTELIASSRDPGTVKGVRKGVGRIAVGHGVNLRTTGGEGIHMGGGENQGNGCSGGCAEVGGESFDKAIRVGQHDGAVMELTGCSATIARSLGSDLNCGPDLGTINDGASGIDVPPTSNIVKNDAARSCIAGAAYRRVGLATQPQEYDWGHCQPKQSFSDVRMHNVFFSFLSSDFSCFRYCEPRFWRAPHNHLCCPFLGKSLLFYVCGSGTTNYTNPFG